MDEKNPYKGFVRRYLTRGAMAFSVGLAALASLAPGANTKVASEEPGTKSFTDKLSAIRLAVTEQIKEENSRLAQLPHPLPPPPRPFANFDNAMPFSNFDNAHPFTNFGKAPLDPKK